MSDNKYFILANSQKEAIDYWNNSQYELADIVLALTDNGIFEGMKLYSVFKHEGFLALMNIFKFNFNLAKKELGINGEYVERGGDIYAEDYNPKRNPQVLTITGAELASKGKDLFDEFEKQFAKLVDTLNKKNNK